MVTCSAGWLPGMNRAHLHQIPYRRISPYISWFSLFMIFCCSAPRWHLLSWVIAWNALEQTCIRLLTDEYPLTSLDSLCLWYSVVAPHGGTSFAGWLLGMNWSRPALDSLQMTYPLTSLDSLCLWYSLVAPLGGTYQYWAGWLRGMN